MTAIVKLSRSRAGICVERGGVGGFVEEEEEEEDLVVDDVEETCCCLDDGAGFWDDDLSFCDCLAACFCLLSSFLLISIEFTAFANDGDLKGGGLENEKMLSLEE